MSLLLRLLTIALLIPQSFSAGKCDLSKPPRSWAVTRGIGIQKWATAGVPTNKEFCVTRDAQGIVEVDYHLDLSDYRSFQTTNYSRTHQSWDNSENHCVMDDPHIKVCFPICQHFWQKKIIEAALSSGAVAQVARTIEESLELDGFGITVLQVDYTNPKTKLNATTFNNLKKWCSVYVGIDPDLGFPYLYEIQLGKLLEEYE
ncbi:hypothetical protein ANCCAN_04846 [Ancylostoma caninum]|uniref:Uncharacterized protein n=1 Tax=Ancylostoma caninum TaxID=29170 RepID=A0A368GXM3_ANCCA|nr:hypothetical protein ANCCAN_04846 [Ancylostoma caninum]